MNSSYNAPERPHLRTVPTIVIAHTFCAAPDTCNLVPKLQAIKPLIQVRVAGPVTKIQSMRLSPLLLLL